MPVCLNCEVEFPNRVEVDGVVRNFQSRKYCLACSPFGQHNTVQIHCGKVRGSSKCKFCTRCQETKTNDLFYKRRNGLSLSAYCKICTNKQTIERQQKLKKQAVEYMGGNCADCGYNRCIAAMEFHHLDPTNKDLSAFGKLVSFEKLKPELDKCILLCCRCHRERHHLIAPEGFEPPT